MKPHLSIFALALVCVTASCERNRPVDRQMKSGAEKVAEGVREMSHAAGKKLDKAAGEAKEKIHEATAPD